MRYLFSLFIIIVLLFNSACTTPVKERTGKIFNLHNHINDYKTARSIPKMPPSKQFHYDNQYAIPDVEEGASLNSDALIIPPESKR